MRLLPERSQTATCQLRPSDSLHTFLAKYVLSSLETVINDTSVDIYRKHSSTLYSSTDM